MKRPNTIALIPNTIVDTVFPMNSLKLPAVETLPISNALSTMLTHNFRTILQILEALAKLQDNYLTQSSRAIGLMVRRPNSFLADQVAQPKHLFMEPSRNMDLRFVAKFRQTLPTKVSKSSFATNIVIDGRQARTNRRVYL